MKKTALYDTHLEANAKMVPFAGYQMPVWFSDIRTEHMAVREKSGLFDISHMQTFAFSGSGAKDFLQKVFCNNVEKCDDNRMVYGMILNETGGILDDVMLTQFEDQYLMVVNASNAEKCENWFHKQGLKDTQMTCLSDTHGFIAIQGPEAFGQAKSILGIDTNILKRMRGYQVMLNGVPVYLTVSGYTGENGLELLIPNAHIAVVWKQLLENGVQPCGLGARDTLRLEAGFPLYGHELSEDINPYMTRYAWVLDLNKPFIGRDALLLLKDSVDTTTVGLVFEDKAIPRSGYTLHEGGVISSGALSFCKGVPIAMALIPKKYSQIGTQVTVDLRSRPVQATVVAVPFI